MLSLRIFSLDHNLIKKIIGTKDAMAIKIMTAGEIAPNKSRLKDKISTYLYMLKITSVFKGMVETPSNNRIYLIQASNPIVNADKKINIILQAKKPTRIFILRAINSIGNIINKNVGLYRRRQSDKPHSKFFFKC